VNDQVKNEGNVTRLANGRKPPEFVEQKVDVSGTHKNKNYVDIKGLGYNAKDGNLSVHLNDNCTLLLKGNFLEKYVHVVLKDTGQIEQSVRSAPRFENAALEQSSVRLKKLGERDGHMFVGPTGSVKFSSALRGLEIQLDDKHTTVIDAQALSKQLGLKMSPIAQEKQVGIGR
jgi:hypothetical protein